MNPLVSLDRVSVSFPDTSGGWRRKEPQTQALDAVSLHILAGETLALVGESGSGKSTIGRVISGLVNPSSGELRFKGQYVDKSIRTKARKAIQIIFQDPFRALDPRMCVSAIVAEPLKIQGIGTPRERGARAAHLIQKVGLPADSLSRTPHAFSGGQRQRIAIARALAQNPELIIADEPLSALDVSTQSQILQLLQLVQDEQKLAYLFISHDLAVVSKFADRVAVLYLGSLVEVASAGDLFVRPAHPYTQALINAVPQLGKRRHKNLDDEVGHAAMPISGCAFHPRCPLVQSLCRTHAPALEAVAGNAQHLAACHYKDKA